MPYAVKIGKKHFLRQGRADTTPTIYHHPSPMQKAIEAFKTRYPDNKEPITPCIWKRGVLSEIL